MKHNIIRFKKIKKTINDIIEDEIYKIDEFYY